MYFLSLGNSDLKIDIVGIKYLNMMTFLNSYF